MTWTSYSPSRPGFPCWWPAGCSARAIRNRSRRTNGFARSISGRRRMGELLRAEGLAAGYGEARVISGLSFTLEDGKSLALLGRNGVGKTTLINTLIGVTTRHGGRISLAGVDLTPMPPH